MAVTKPKSIESRDAHESKSACALSPSESSNANESGNENHGVEPMYFPGPSRHIFPDDAPVTRSSSIFPPARMESEITAWQHQPQPPAGVSNEFANFKVCFIFNCNRFLFLQPKDFKNRTS